MDGSVLRVLDANINRACEGLRVVEEVARFVLDHAEMSERLKSLRHTVRSLIDPSLLLPNRDSVNDVGMGVLRYGSAERDGIPAIVGANLKRAQEAIRVIEEFSKLSELNIPVDKIAAIERARFEVYTIEKELNDIIDKTPDGGAIC
ncbi:MAG: thiamine-phosphate pyrophosphorylase [Brevinematales bacterium]|nr:thiamine-phosphate pyrophosphorylase [Brevinematales bacterium]